jgi:hypothetical protein
VLLGNRYSLVLRGTQFSIAFAMEIVNTSLRTCPLRLNLFLLLRKLPIGAKAGEAWAKGARLGKLFFDLFSKSSDRTFRFESSGSNELQWGKRFALRMESFGALCSRVAYFQVKVGEFFLLVSCSEEQSSHGR